MKRSFGRSKPLQSVAFRRELPCKLNPNWFRLTPTRDIQIGYRKTKPDTAGRWVGRVYFGGSDRMPDGSTPPIKERTLADADDLEGANGKDVLSFEQALLRVAAFAKEQGIECDPATFIKPPTETEAHIQMMRQAVSRKRAETVVKKPEPEPAPAPPSGNGAARPKPPTAEVLRFATPLAENQKALDGLSRGIRGLRAAHEALCENDPRLLVIAAEFMASADDLFCSVLREAGMIPTTRDDAEADSGEERATAQGG